MGQRKIICTHCGQELEISSRTVSLCCDYCRRQISVEDHFIDSYHAVINIETCGSLDITSKGQVRARIRVQDAKVGGQVYGNITARGKVSVDSGARVVGDITAPSLEVGSGAELKGFFRIGSQEGSSDSG